MKGAVIVIGDVSFRGFDISVGSELFTMAVRPEPDESYIDFMNLVAVVIHCLQNFNYRCSG